MSSIDGQDEESELQLQDIQPKKRALLYSVGNDETSYKGNQLSRVISVKPARD